MAVRVKETFTVEEGGISDDRTGSGGEAEWHGEGELLLNLKGLLIRNRVKNKKQTQSNESQSNPNPACFKPGDLVKLIIGGNLLLECTGTVERSPKDIDISVSINGDSDN